MKITALQLIISGFMLFLGVASAHEDTTLEVQEGRLLGLPSDYSPASFDTKNLELRIGDKRLLLPSEIRRVLMKDVSPDPFDGPRILKTIPCNFEFTASWYHEIFVGGLPPYLVVKVIPKEAECSFEILVDIVAVEVIEADAIIKGIGRVRIQLEDPYKPKKQKENKSEMATPRKPSD